MSPIRPENKHRYPRNWNEIRTKILTRAKNRCEMCGAENRYPHPITLSKVVLTIAHMDHTPENCADDNLKALCQRCHNRYDAKTRARGRKERAEIASPQLSMFGGKP
jgi:5-methylcytosine-specific restriction endonuclease McrA